MSVLPAFMSVSHVYAWCPQRSEDGSQETGIRDRCEPPCGLWESNPGLQEFLKAEQSLQPLLFFQLIYAHGCFTCIYVCALCLQRPKKDVRFPELELEMIVSCLMGAGKSNHSPLEEWPVFLTTEYSFQPHYILCIAIFRGLRKSVWMVLYTYLSSYLES